MVADGHWPRDLGKMCWTLTESPEKKICYKILWNNLCWQWETSRSMFKQMYHWYCTYLMRSYLLTILASKSHIRELPCSSNLRWTRLFWSIRSRCILRTFSIVGQPLCRSGGRSLEIPSTEGKTSRNPSSSSLSLSAAVAPPGSEKVSKFSRFCKKSSVVVGGCDVVRDKLFCALMMRCSLILADDRMLTLKLINFSLLLILLNP